jgi:hypothetical protein
LKIEKIFRVSEDHPLRDIPDTILECAEKTTEDELVRDHHWVKGSEQYKDILGKGYLFYEGSVSDDGSPADLYLFNFDLNKPEEDFILINSGGY